MAADPSVEPWSPTMMRSAHRLTPSRKRSRIHASFFTGVTQTICGLSVKAHRINAGAPPSAFTIGSSGGRDVDQEVANALLLVALREHRERGGDTSAPVGEL